MIIYDDVIKKFCIGLFIFLFEMLPKSIQKISSYITFNVYNPSAPFLFLKDMSKCNTVSTKRHDKYIILSSSTLTANIYIKV